MSNLTYAEKKRIADSYIDSICGLDWDSLSDINSLHDCETESDIIEYCNDRLFEEDFPDEFLY